MEEDNTADAIRFCKEALRYTGNRLEPTNNLGYLLACTGEYTSARTYFEQASKMQGVMMPLALYNTAMMDLVAGNIEQARSSLSRAEQSIAGLDATKQRRTVDCAIYAEPTADGFKLLQNKSGELDLLALIRTASALLVDR